MPEDQYCWFRGVTAMTKSISQERDHQPWPLGIFVAIPSRECGGQGCPRIPLHNNDQGPFSSCKLLTSDEDAIGAPELVSP